jgi:hypothetical protein
MNIGIDRHLDLVRGFRISQGGMVLVTKNMLAKINEDSENQDNLLQVRKTA